MFDESGSNFESTIRKVGNKVKDVITKTTEEQRIAQEEKDKVYENVLTFTSADIQVPKAEFRSGNKMNTIELQKEKPGTIFRITWEPSGGMSNVAGGSSEVYSWLVLGRDKNDDSHMYEIFSKSTNRVPQQGGELKLPIDDIDMYKLKRQVKEFKVDDTLQTFFGMGEEYGKVVKVDRMWGGSPEQSKRTNEHKGYKRVLGELSPIPQGNI